MLKNLLTLFFLFVYIISHAQVVHSSTALNISIASEEYQLTNLSFIGNEQFSFNASNLGIREVPFAEYGNRLTIGIGIMKSDNHENSHTAGIFGAHSRWDRLREISFLDTIGGKTLKTTTESTIGIRYTFGLSVIHKNDLNFLIGFRGEIGDSFLFATSDIDFIGHFDYRINRVFVRTYVMPEIQYYFSNIPIKCSLRFGLPIFNIGHTGDSQDIGHEERLKDLILQSKIKDDVKVTKEIYKNGEIRDSFFEHGRRPKHKRFSGTFWGIREYNLQLA